MTRAVALLLLIHSQRDTIHLDMSFVLPFVHVGDGQVSFLDILLEVACPAPSVTIIVGGGRGW